MFIGNAANRFDLDNRNGYGNQFGATGAPNRTTEIDFGSSSGEENMDRQLNFYNAKNADDVDYGDSGDYNMHTDGIMVKQTNVATDGDTDRVSAQIERVGVIGGKGRSLKPAANNRDKHHSLIYQYTNAIRKAKMENAKPLVSK